MATSIAINARESIKRNVLRPLLLGMGKTIAPFSPVGNAPVFSNSKFPWTSLLEENWPVIRKELDHVLTFNDSLPNLQDIQHEQSSITTDNKWNGDERGMVAVSGVLVEVAVVFAHGFLYYLVV